MRGGRRAVSERGRRAVSEREGEMGRAVSERGEEGSE